MDERTRSLRVHLRAVQERKLSLYREIEDCEKAEKLIQAELFADSVVGPPKKRRAFQIHKPSDCAGEACCFHNPSDHHMRGWKMEIRFDRGNLVERICPHGIGHPDPDSLAWLKRVGSDDDGTHGCDGCCRRRQ